MTNEINAQNELDLILKGMEEIDNRAVQEATVELDYFNEEDATTQLEEYVTQEEQSITDDVEIVEEQYLVELETEEESTDVTEELEAVEQPVEVPAESEALEVAVEVPAESEALEVSAEASAEPETVEEVVEAEIPEKKGFFGSIFGGKKNSKQQEVLEPTKTSADEELVESQKRIEELQEISAERLAVLEKLSFEADEMRRQTLQLERHTLSLEEKTRQLNEEKDAIKKEADALESLLQEKYVRIEELENMLQDPDVISNIGLEISSNDIRTMIRDILPDIKAMSSEAMVDFSLKVDDVYDPIVFCDRDRINSMIIKMIFCGLRFSNTGELLKFSISQKEPVAAEYAEYIYSCVYKGDVVDFYSDEAAEMGGIVDIKRSEDGYVDMSVRFRFKIDIPELRERTLEITKSVLEENL